MKHLVHLDYITVEGVCQEGDVHVWVRLESFLRKCCIFVLVSIFFVISKEKGPADTDPFKVFN